MNSEHLPEPQDLQQYLVCAPGKPLPQTAYRQYFPFESFTVYGPAGRPDMAYFGFTEKLKRGERIQIYNYGNCKRDFTYMNWHKPDVRHLFPHHRRNVCMLPEYDKIL